MVNLALSQILCEMKSLRVLFMYQVGDISNFSPTNDRAMIQRAWEQQKEGISD